MDVVRDEGREVGGGSCGLVVRFAFAKARVVPFRGVEPLVGVRSVPAEHR